MLLRGLKRHVKTGVVGQLAAVVTVADDGGSSGRLRRDFGMLPPGDVRSCIAALADDEHLLSRLFQYRFPGGEGLAGHSFGNLFLAALAAVTGSFYQAILETEHILSVRGRILPSTLESVQLLARGASGALYQGESAIGRAGERLRRVELAPADAAAFPQAVEALRAADVVVLGPGSLFTSIVPNLLIPGIRQALRETEALVILPLNLMTQPGETEALDALDHLAVVQEHLGADGVDLVLVSSRPPAPERLAPYVREGAVPVAVAAERLAARGVEVMEADLLAEGELIRHDAEKLADAMLEAWRAASLLGEARR
ncbi:MAG TPA: uridine diphosphate-N-acetylglucosamine-binding protein YvcK [Thermoanaerobaculia bacterium]|nr:uridine diphosphate-N-acetylglucosamine-binding protein YvcK [Thermoanaerobaculia bacterium]